MYVCKLFSVFYSFTLYIYLYTWLFFALLLIGPSWRCHRPTGIQTPVRKLLLVSGLQKLVKNCEYGQCKIMYIYKCN